MSERRVESPEQLDQETGRALLEQVEPGSVTEGEVIVLDLSRTKQMDSRGGAWLVEMARRVRARNAEFRWEGEHGNVAHFMEVIAPGLMAKPPKQREHPSLMERVGDQAIRFGSEMRDFMLLLVDAIYWTFIGVFEGRGFRWGLLIDELHEMGVRAIKINLLMNFLLGLIIAMLSAAQIEPFGLGIYVADLLMIAFARELASLMTAVVVSARTGAAIAAELATMKVQEEIDALRGMGLNVAQFLVAPKVLALLLVMPCLVAMGMLAGIAGGSIWGIFVLDIRPEVWFQETYLAAKPADVFQGMLKCLFFALMIVLVGCHNGLRVRGGSRGVGLMTTRAVVMDIFFIVVIDMIFAWVFYYVVE